MNDSALALDGVIFGGGAAGLFALARARAAGRSAILLERDALGAGQSRCAQGIIHGGVKYSLGGFVGDDSRAIAGMPERWLRLLEGAEAPWLPGSALRAEHGWLWRSEGLAGRIGMLGARFALRVRPEAVSDADRPASLRSIRGEVLRLPEPIVDPSAVLAAIASAHHGCVLRHRAERLEILGVGDRVRLRATIECRGGDRTLDLDAGCVMLAAGVGNEALRERFGCPAGRTQRRPLHQVLVRSPSLPWLDGHCVSGDATRVTITSARDCAERIVWHLGGQLAERGIARDRDAQVRFAAQEIRAVVPGIDLDGAELAAYRVDRAEPLEGGRRPDDARVIVDGPVISIWPTKLALAPRAADEALARLESIVPAGASDASAAIEALQPIPPAPAPPPWDDALAWTPA